jgi:cyclophilin family peptidyl-prolyl cis-trans isomerase/HEAT repeat protein
MNRITISLLVALVVICSQMACVPPSNEIKTAITFDLSDATFQKIRDFQDRQQIDSLYAFFRHDDPTYRYFAALAFGSIKSAATIDSLAVLLQDPVDKVRAAAAFSIGQIGDESGQAYLVNAFERTDTAGLFRQTNKEVLEAVGRCGDEEMLQAMSTITTYNTRDTALLEGQVLGIYRYALRGMVAREGTEKMLSYIAARKYPASVRLVAANYLSRAKNITLDSLQGDIIADAFVSEPVANIRMALALALSKVKTATSLNQLLQQFSKEQDYRVKCNILSSLSAFDYEQVEPLALEALKAPEMPVALRAVNFFVENGQSGQATTYWKLAKDTIPWQAQIGMYQAANRHLPAYFVDYRDAINAELRQRLRSADSPFEKKAIIQALAEFPWNYKYLYEQGFRAESPIIRTATVEALATISERSDFRGYFGRGYRTVRKDLLGYFNEAMQTGDPALIATAAIALRNDRLGFNRYIDSLTVYESALEQLELPKELEAYNELNHTIAYFKGEEVPAPLMPEYSHPIDWSMLNRVATGQRLIINTNRGDIELAPLAEDAPGTVANFVALVRQGFYQDKYFHRVVPNFVIQGGCSRGDGYGNLNYTIRSEFSLLHYDQEGYVGMASIGNHTEGTQFFITHSPSLHLDGNYTIFAKVVEGMDIVHKIQAGDRINTITIQ